MTTQPTRDQLRALANAATPGPWETFKTSRGRDNGIGSASPTVPSDEAVMEDAWSDPADAAFIVAARNALPALLDALDRAEAEVRAAKAEALREAAVDIVWSAETLPDMTPHDAARGLVRRADRLEAGDQA